MGRGGHDAAPGGQVREPVMFLQPVVDLTTGQTVGVEALARRTHGGAPVGESTSGGPEWEAACIRAARAVTADLPPGVVLSVNASPDALSHPLVAAALGGDLAGLVVEVTEQPSSDVEQLRSRLAELRSRGARIAVDDVGIGHSDLLRVAQLRPDVVKVDRALVTGIAQDPARAAVVASLVALARRLDALVLAEGVEDTTDLVAVAVLDVDLAQGWQVGMPGPRYRPASDVVATVCRSVRRRRFSLDATFVDGRADSSVIHSITAALAEITDRPLLERLLADAAEELGASQLTLSVLGADSMLRELATTADILDASGYALADYPATVAAIDNRRLLEIQVDDPAADPAEIALLRRAGMTTLLLVPLYEERRVLGILEMAWAQRHRCTGRDIEHAMVLGEHVATALRRIRPDVSA